MLSERLGVPGLTLAGNLAIEGGTVTIRRDSDDASTTITGSLPCLVSVTDQTGEARYPSFKGIMAAKSKPVDAVTASDLGLDAGQVGWGGARQEIVNVAQAPARQAGEKFEDDGTGAEKVVAFLEQLKVV
jgi:electron transfer flavoprotein beta subunit